MALAPACSGVISTTPQVSPIPPLVTPVITPEMISDQPRDNPAPFAASRAPRRFWPVVTTSTNWAVVPAELRNGGFVGDPLRTFNAPRPSAQADNPTRRHAGVDLYARPNDRVIAVEDGRIVAFYPFLTAATGEVTYALLVAHDGYVANYGEVRETSLDVRGLRIGDAVRAGQDIADISDTSQLHFETYVAGVDHNQSWRHGDPRPDHVLNPTRLLLDLAQHGERRLPVLSANIDRVPVHD